jgi:DNA polymerase-3 subunit delta'
MPFDQIRGQESAVTLLRNALRNGRLAHAYIFLGPEGVGKRLTALTLAKALNCQSPPTEAECCEKCSSCLKVNSSNHADVIVVEPAGEVMKIDQVRDLQRRLRYRPMEGGKRACILDSADSLNEAASNALLKTLEESLFFGFSGRRKRRKGSGLQQSAGFPEAPGLVAHLFQSARPNHGRDFRSL